MARGTGGQRRDVTVADVARLAGVGKATAARALGNYGQVSEEKRRLVEAAAESLGYRPNELARSMNTGRTRTLGVILGDIENSYFSLATRGISDTARAAGYDVILLNTSERLDDEIDAVRVLVDKRVDALIVSPVSSYATDHLSSAATDGRPVILLDRAAPDMVPPAPTVEVDIAPAAREATTELVRLGHRRIAFLSSLTTDGPVFSGFPLSVSSVAGRIRGILQGLEDADLPVDHTLFRFRAEGRGRTATVIDDLLGIPDPPTALFASDSLVARDVLAALRARDLRIPRDISLVSFDNTGWEEFTDPPLSVVEQPVYETGVAAARAALTAVGEDLPEDATGNPGRLQGRLILRESVGPPSTTPGSRPPTIPRHPWSATHS